MAETDLRARSLKGPDLGEHTREILAEAGFSKTEATCMIENGTAAVAGGDNGA